ncbi:NAD(P)H-binding protein [Shouchella sp. 1P09AA]|uniref:NAD(P)H-binding protein n=1 Tax=unclassified Shouchella TaxID=2893065 RepID=UPI00399FBFC6
MAKKPIIAISGASGYIGKNLMNQLQDKAHIIALSRSIENKENTDNVTWRQADLFSLSDSENALKDVDYAVYLVHSMLPSAKLTQAKFEDMDFILADNFAQAAQKNQVKQIIYLSGILPDNEKELSRHLESRREVEMVLNSYTVPVTTVRAGLIVGPSGSSFPIVKKLVKRLPMMILPKWTRQKTQPVALPDVLHALDGSIGNKDVTDKSIDVAGPEVMTYRDIMLETADVMGKKRKMISVPFMSVKLSRLWVSVTTGTPKEMVYPLIESLIHPMVAEASRMHPDLSYGQTSFREAAQAALEEEAAKGNNQKKSLPAKPQKVADVRSIQRVPLPKEHSADWLGRYYLQWLESIGKPFLHAKENDHRSSIYLFNKKMLEFSYAKERSHEQRALYYITGGAFAKVNPEPGRGRIEFRKIPHKDECIIAIHEYQPSLPWILYTFTQANMHIWVMFLFKKHLERMIRKDSLPSLKFEQFYLNE